MAVNQSSNTKLLSLRNDAVPRPGCKLPIARLSRWVGVVFILLVAWLNGFSQTAVVSDAWWTFQQDCNGDGIKAGTLEGDFARLNWASDVSNCNGTLNVYEKVYYRPCGTSAWTPIYTNAAHSITGCRSVGHQYVDISMGAGGECRDYKVEIFRVGRATPDSTRSSTNDVDLAQHREQALSEDFCLSDFFATCVALSGAVGSQSDNNSYATKESGEPDHAGNPGGRSLWYCWTAMTNRPVTFDTTGSSFDTVLAVYAGESLANLTLVGSNDDIAGATNRQSQVTFTPTIGVTYRIAVDGFSGAAGIVVLNWNQTGGGLADLIIWGPATSPRIVTRTLSSSSCEVREGCVVSGTRKLLEFTTETRNIGTGDLVMGNPATNSLFHWASCHQHYHFEQFAEFNLMDTNGNVAATGRKIGFCLEDVRPWSPTASPQLKYNCNYQGIQKGWADVYSAGLPCQYIDITALPPGNYILQMIVNPDSLLPESNLENNITLVSVNIPPSSCPAGSAPANDHFTNSITVAVTPFTQSVFNNCATKQSGEPNHAGNSGGHSVWFNWTPAESHTAVITTRSSNFDTTLAVYTGTAVNALSLVAANDDIVAGVNRQSQVAFAAMAGTTYRIVIDGFNNAVGNAALNINPAANDDFTNAFVLSGLLGSTHGHTTGASKESGEPAHAFDVGGYSVWYAWTAPASGPVDFNTRGSTFDTTLAVYSNHVLTNLTLIAANDDDLQGGGLLSSRLSFIAVAGVTYRIAVDGFGGVWGEFQLNWNMESRLGITQLPDGALQLTLTGVDWQRYTLLGSSDLESWFTNTPPITMAGGSHQYTNAPAANDAPGAQQFFRAVLVP